MITLQFHLIPQYKYELFHIYFTVKIVVVLARCKFINDFTRGSQYDNGRFYARRCIIPLYGLCNWMNIALYVYKVHIFVVELLVLMILNNRI